MDPFNFNNLRDILGHHGKLLFYGQLRMMTLVDASDAALILLARLGKIRGGINSIESP